MTIPPLKQPLVLEWSYGQNKRTCTFGAQVTDLKVFLPVDKADCKAAMVVGSGVFLGRPLPRFMGAGSEVLDCDEVG